MRRTWWVPTVVLVALVAITSIAPDRAYSALPVNTSQTFDYTGATQTFTVPTGVTTVQDFVRGAHGGGLLGGFGAEMQGDFTVTRN